VSTKSKAHWPSEANCGAQEKHFWPFLFVNTNYSTLHIWICKNIFNNICQSTLNCNSTNLSSFGGRHIHQQQPKATLDFCPFWMAVLQGSRTPTFTSKFKGGFRELFWVLRFQSLILPTMMVLWPKSIACSNSVAHFTFEANFETSEKFAKNTYNTSKKVHCYLSVRRCNRNCLGLLNRI